MISVKEELQSDEVSVKEELLEMMPIQEQRDNPETAGDTSNPDMSMEVDITSVKEEFDISSIKDELSETTSVKEESWCTSPRTARVNVALSSKSWCRDCSKEATEDCADSSHTLWSLGMCRAGHAMSVLDQVNAAKRSTRVVVRALQEARDAVDAQLEQWSGRLRQVEGAENELLETGPGHDLKAFQVEGVEHLARDAASLLKTSCQLHLKGDGDREWSADPQLTASGWSLVYPLLMQVQQDGSLVKVFRPDESMDATQECQREELGQESEDHGLDNLYRVRRLAGVRCKKRPVWCLGLLQRVAPRLKCLWVSDALRGHLEVVRDAARRAAAWIPWRQAPARGGAMSTAEARHLETSV